MPKFNKGEDELETMFDKWMYVLKNLYRLLERPKALQDRIFKKLFEQAEIARYSDDERWQYEESKKIFWDNYSVMETAHEKGIHEGKEIGRSEANYDATPHTARCWPFSAACCPAWLPTAQRGKAGAGCRFCCL